MSVVQSSSKLNPAATICGDLPIEVPSPFLFSCFSSTSDHARRWRWTWRLQNSRTPVSNGCQKHFKSQICELKLPIVEIPKSVTSRQHTVTNCQQFAHVFRGCFCGLLRLLRIRVLLHLLLPQAGRLYGIGIHELSCQR